MVDPRFLEAGNLDTEKDGENGTALFWQETSDEEMMWRTCVCFQRQVS